MTKPCDTQGNFTLAIIKSTGAQQGALAMIKPLVLTSSMPGSSPQVITMPRTAEQGPLLNTSPTPAWQQPLVIIRPPGAEQGTLLNNRPPADQGA